MAMSISPKVNWKQIAQDALNLLWFEQDDYDTESLVRVIVRAMDHYCKTSTIGAGEYITEYLSDHDGKVKFMDLCIAWDFQN